MSAVLIGRCLCGACSFTAEAAPRAGVCHCGICRRWSGGMFIAVVCQSMDFAEGAPVACYQSTEWGQRFFCRECGSSLAFRSLDGSHTAVSIQAFDEPGNFEIVSEIFIDEKPANYALANETKTMTGSEFMAMFASKAEAGA